MKVEFLNALGIFTCILIYYFSLIIMIITYFNFHLDSDKFNLDFLGLTRLSKNITFDLCPYFECENKNNNSFTYLVVYNILMLNLLLFQGLYLISKSFREILLKNCYYWQKYYCIIIPKIVYNFMIIMSMFLYQPLTYYNYDLSDNIRIWWLYFFSLIGVAMISATFKFHLYYNDELYFKLLYILFNDRDIPKLEENIIGKDKIYHISRSPFRGGVMLFTLFVSPIWNMGRIIYIIILFIYIHMETNNEEIYYAQRYEFYRWYINSIPNQYFGLTVHKLISNKKKE